ncbi:SusC/RagA family TonB-linked outer membrane protein [Myroides marinus]|uniref:SusC/RagA family TonB-linked outer membrane protein n=3 Tax=Myroides marinus TaxID=703342 RepID=UPI002578D143|nr:SusC/RagA family TonB-linked outer membrane protein [Myroides marinus]MDM1373710.1 SusC/RagA family TonB-linked outer membrane protein [Myroides marinus]MDM1405337.1 SusC/RagA family TonB-linked outer membrane protein [Myroides marinus]
MKTHFLTKSGYRIALILSFTLTYPTYVVSKDNLINLDYQDKTIIGTVKDKDGPLMGAIIQIKGTDTATTTDINGKYSLNASNGDILVISYIGYITKEIIVTSDSIYNINLLQDQDILSEVVINAGYYSVKDKERTGSIARVTSKDLEFQPVNNPLQAIQGRVPGVDIIQQSGVTGGGIKIEIRGQNFMGSMNSGRNSPLYLVDGVPFPSDAFGINNGSLALNILQNGISPLNSISPSDIESIEILKDADATAIYGSRGANGVVLITTKKAKSNKTQFTFSSSVDFSKVPKFMNMMNTQQYIQMREEAFANSGITTYPINAYDINGAWDRNRYTNWQKQLIGDTAVSKNISFGMSGGGAFSTFNIKLNHNESTTVFPTDKGYKRNSVLINFNHNSKNNKLQINTSTTYSDQSNDLPATDFTSKSLTLAPNAPSLFNKDGSLNWENGTFTNPLASLEETYENKIKTLNINTQFSYNVLKNTFIKVNTGITSTDFEEVLLQPHTIINPALGRTSAFSESKLATQKTESYIIEPQLNYQNIWGKNKISFLIGFTYQNTNASASQMRGKNFSSNALIRNISAAKEKILANTSKSKYNYTSIFSRLNYTYDDKYIANITTRRDGSSRFGENNRFGNFGAVGLAWIVSEETFLKDLSFLSFAKLRTSYGITGSDNIGNYAYLDTYTINNSKYDDEVGLAPTSLHNPNFKWEKTTKFEAALEFSLFKNTINSSVAYYNNRSTDQLVGLTLPSTTGFDRITGNSPAVVENTGWEFTLNTNNINSNTWRWSTNFNLSFPKNKLVSYPGLEEGTQSSTYVIGQPLNILKFYQYQGIDPITGLYQFKDFNNDGIINYLDQQLVKNFNPEFLGGLQNTISYKNFTLDFLFYFTKRDNYNLNYGYNVPGSIMQNMPIEMLDRWSIDNPNSTYSQATYSNTTILQQAMPFKNSDNSISDASYIRLKNASISYLMQIPKLPNTSLRIYLQGQNLWTITSYKGIDPEFISYGNLPPLRTYSFGASLIF